MPPDVQNPVDELSKPFEKYPFDVEKDFDRKAAVD